MFQESLCVIYGSVYCMLSIMFAVKNIMTHGTVFYELTVVNKGTKLH